MKVKHNVACLLLAAALVLSGCTMRTVDQMYCLPKRSEDYRNLQTAIDEAMGDLEYSAPMAGDHQQTVQTADLDGDGRQEYLLFAKSTSDSLGHLRILIFRENNGTYAHIDTIENTGASFDQVEYVQMDDKAGLELVVGCKLSDQVLRSVSVYTFSGQTAQRVLSTNYTKFVVADLDEDKKTELFILRPGETESDNGIAELYGIENGKVTRSNEVKMSAPANQLKRVIVGLLEDRVAAVYVASAAGETALITDVYAPEGDLLQNVVFANESGGSVQAIRNYYVYADDIDDDGVIELPRLISMRPLEQSKQTDVEHLILWYAITSKGKGTEKLYTYHNFVAGWYLELHSQWAKDISVASYGNEYVFYIWDEDEQVNKKVMTIFALTGQNRDELARTENRFALLKTDTVTYAALLEAGVDAYGISQSGVIEDFHLIQQDWKTGET